MIFQGDDLGITMDSLMKTSVQCVVAVKKASKVLGSIKDRTIWKNITACISLKGSSLNICCFISTFKKSDRLESTGRKVVREWQKQQFVAGKT